MARIDPVAMSRRQFVFSLGALAFVPPAELRPRNPVRTDSWTSSERAIVEALCEQIFPKDEFAGARELGIADFLEQTLMKAHPEWRAAYRAGLQSVETSCRELHKKGFLELAFEEQTRFMESMESARLPARFWPGPSAADYFSMLRAHTLQGVYSHPRYGGNRGRQAWKMIGYDDRWAE
jgi:gluconate 2-dehydrogenase gamma chain